MAVHPLLIYILIAILSKGESLTCLHCKGVDQPRHCRAVVDCFQGEICGVEKVLDDYGDYVYNLGCMSYVECGRAHEVNTSNTEACRHCCESDICNSQGCGETGYPVSRGPICFSCPVHREGRTCHNIDFCKIGEMCQFQEIEEFGDLVINTQCIDAHTCHNSGSGNTVVVGRSTDIKDEHVRTTEQHVCDACCSNDLCNRDCHTTHTSGSHFTPVTTTTSTQTQRPSTSSSTTPSFQTTIGVISTTVVDGNTVLALFGQEMVKYVRVNETRVIRGANWSWGDQDSHGPGTIVGWTHNSTEVYVKWDNGDTYNYRMGYLGLYDLYIISIQ